MMLIPNQSNTLSIDPRYITGMGYHQPYDESYIVWVRIIHEESYHEMGEFDSKEEAAQYYEQLKELIDNGGFVIDG